MNNIIVYHGSPEKFDNFSIDFIGSNKGTTGAGFGLYFSSDKNDATRYGNYVYTCMLMNLQKPLSNDKITFTYKSLENFIDLLENLYEKENDIPLSILNLYSNSKAQSLNMLLKSNLTDTEIIGDLINGAFGGNPEIILNTLKIAGYTHTIDNDSPINDTIKHYIIYDVNCIKILEKNKLYLDKNRKLIEKIELTEEHELKNKLENIGFNNVLICEIEGIKHIEFTYIEFKSPIIFKILFSGLNENIVSEMIANNYIISVKSQFNIDQGKRDTIVTTKKNIFKREIENNINYFLDKLIQKL